MVMTCIDTNFGIVSSEGIGTVSDDQLYWYNVGDESELESTKVRLF